MGLNFAVSATFKAKDEQSRAFKRMSKNAGLFGEKSSRAFKQASKSATSFGTITKSILAAGLVQKALGGISAGISSVATQFIEFDDAITGAGARFKDIGPDAENFEKQLQQIKKAARDAGATTEFTAAQSANALDFLARAGFTSAEAMGSLRSMINLSTATGEDFASVADMSSDLLGAFGMNANNTAQKIKNLNRLNDVLVKTTNSANVTIENMFETMKQVGPVATGVLGASLEEVSALTAVLGNSGIKGSDAMTALRNAYLRLAAPVGEGAKILKDMNITLDDGKGGAKKMTDLMSELGGKMKGLGKIKQAEILDAVFGKRAIAGGKNLLDNIQNIKKFEKTLLNAGGIAEKTAELMRKSLGNRLKTLNSAAVDLGFKLFEAFSRDGKNGIDVLTNAIRSFDMNPVIEGIKSAVSIFRELFTLASSFIQIAKPLLAFWATYKTVVLAAAAAQAIMTAASWAYAVFVKAQIFMTLATSIGFASTAMGILNVIMAANPIFLIVAVIAGIIALTVILVKNWDAVTEAVSNAFEAIWNILKIGGSIAGSFFNIGGDNKNDSGTPGREPPNKTQVEANKTMGLNGTIKIKGAPAGSTGEIDQPAGVNMDFAGVS